MSRRALADAAERNKATRERKRNVIVDAGAGTGKTTLLVERMLHLIAPDDDGPALELERVVAITFTRKAAGELKLRLREAVLEHVALSELSPLRRERLSRALAGLDNAPISTVHSFADRMLRLRPADAGVSPRYEIIEDASALIDVTLRWLLDSAQRGSLTMAGCTTEQAAEAAQTVRLFQAAGLRVHTLDSELYCKLGLDAFVRDVIETRDRPVEVPSLGDFDRSEVQKCCDELAELVRDLPSQSEGAKTLRRMSDRASQLLAAGSFPEALRRAVSWSLDASQLKGLRKGEDYDGDPDAWAAHSWLVHGNRGSGKKREERPGGPLCVALTQPLFAQMAIRLVRLRPFILAHYAEVKRARAVLDHIDLLIGLRDLLARDREARAFYQARFDHFLVDEFQDTDPLQAEIILYLCEAGAHASAPEQVQLSSGKLTIVGDPKQSIYRFRRADIAMYAAVCQQLRRSNACEARLSVNFRSAPSILSWLNAGFDEVLGPEQEPMFDAEAGTVCNLHLRAADERTDGAVHVLPFGDEDLLAEQARDIEGEALARYLRHLVEDGGTQIRDPRTRELRRPRYGDIAVVMVSTQTVHHLTAELDRVGVRHSVRGGTLFMQDPLHQQFVLGLRALSDRDDGVARAALLRPPFFAVSLEDIARAKLLDQSTPEWAATDSIITELRRTRHEAPAGEVARRVLERTGFGAYVAGGVNGAQRLARLYALCTAFDELARSAGLDFDGVTEIARSWVEAPPRIEAPLPVDADAVQVITAHQAKGLEWPIVALWDGRALWRAYLPQVAFTVDALSGAWALKLDGLAYDPTERALHERELELRAAERKRVAYVAATRARDILIVPEAGAPKEKAMWGTLILAASELPQERVDRYAPVEEGWWNRAKAVSARPVGSMARELDARWHAAALGATQPRLQPLAITTHAHADAALQDVVLRKGRFGPVFGAAVHRALQLVLERGLHAEVAIELAGAALSTVMERAEALADVRRALVGLGGEGLLGHTLRLEYPIAGAVSGQSLLVGAIDLLAVSDTMVSIVDFKTDAPPREAVEVSHAGYVEQIKTYASLLQRSGAFAGRSVRCGLLFTAEGTLRWV